MLRNGPLLLSAAAMTSQWLDDGLVLEAEGSGPPAVPASPRQRTLPPGSPMPGRLRSPLASPAGREGGAAGSPQAQTMGKARELFVLCDKEGKGFITKRDMQVSPAAGTVLQNQLFKNPNVSEPPCFLRPEAAGGAAAVARAAGGGVRESGPAEQRLPHARRVQHRPR